MRIVAAMVCLSSVIGLAQTAVPVPKAADVAFRAIYTADDAWRHVQYGSESKEDEAAHLSPLHLPHVDAKTQAAELQHWTDILSQLDKLDAKALSPDEYLNFEVYRAQIVVSRNAQQYREYERPANSDSSFWSYLAPLDSRGLRNAEQYRRYVSRMSDIPRFFSENIANMRAGLARGFTPPQVTLTGRDQSIRLIADAKSAEDTAFWKPFTASMPRDMTAAEQADLQTKAKTIIEQQVVPAYKQLLAFWTLEYVPHSQRALAATALPDGKAYYQSLILEYATITDTPEQIHALGQKEMEGIHAEMLATMKAAGFTGDLPGFLKFLRTDSQFYAKTPQELLDHAAWVAKEFDGVASRYFGYEPRGRFGIVPVPPEIAPFYTAGRGGESSYLLNTYDLPSRPLYALPALTLHESAPGHSWQGSISEEQARERKLPDFRRAYISAYGEG